MPFPALRKKSTTEPDIRIVRLAVSIFQTGTLRNYFQNEDGNLLLALKYFRIIPHKTELDDLSYDHFVDLLNLIYTQHNSNFGAFLEYVVKDYQERGKGYPWLDKWMKLSEIRHIEKELLALGFTVIQDWNTRFDSVDLTIVPAQGHTEEDLKISTVLESKLSRLNPDFVKMFRGAWEAFYSKNPDSPRQVISSARELLNQVTTQLGGTGERKARIESILGSNKESKLVEALANTVDNLYAVASKGTHTTVDSESSLFALKIIEYMLYYILTRSKT